MVHLYQSLKNTVKFGFKSKIIEDSLGNSVSNFGLIFKSILLGNILLRLLENNSARPIGLMLPNIVPTAIIFFAIQYLGKTAAIINFTSGSKNIISCLEKSDIKYIVTSKKFIDQGDMGSLITKIENKNYKFIYLEDIRKILSLKDKLFAIKDFILNVFISKKLEENQSAVILYTSGTESDPKGVNLTHQNLFSNRMQVLESLKINRNEKFFTCLPFFHSFGLGIGVLLPILYGCKVFLYPTPLHFQTIPKLINETKSTVFFSTDTFLKKYIPHINKSTFNNLKYLIAGAEKVDVSTHEQYREFGVQILEGYGVTEASPAVSVNTKENYKIGSVGKFISGVDYKIEKIDGYEEGGLLFIKGKNVITKYLGQSEEFDWYNTGDVVRVDKEGYLFILGRLKRFAKIAGEMISLSQIEEFPKKLWPENTSIVCSIKDEKKGEALILLTDNKNSNLSELSSFMQEAGLSNLYFPKKIKIISEFPILGSGKINFRSLQEIAES
mgnify:FL=1